MDAAQELFLTQSTAAPLDLIATRAGVGRAEAAASRAAVFNQQRHRAGTSSLMGQLDIERQRISAAAGLVQGRAALTSSYVAIQKSLGLRRTPAK